MKSVITSTAHRVPTWLRLWLVVVLVGGLATALPVNPSRAATLTVTSSGNAGAGTLRDTIAAAAPGDTIVFSLPNPTTITLASEIAFSKSLIIQGPGATQLFISGGNGTTNTNRVFNISGAGVSVNISGLTIRNGRLTGLSDNGAGISHTATGTLTLRSVSLTNNRTIGNDSIGVAVYNGPGSSVVVQTSTITGNVGTGTFNQGGAVFNDRGNLTVRDSDFSQNLTNDRGGAIYTLGTTSSVNIFSSLFFSNTSVVNSGGAIYQKNEVVGTASGTMFIANSTFKTNLGGQTGGAIRHEAFLTIANSTIEGNTAFDATFGLRLGGGLSSTSTSAVTVTNTIVANNVGAAGTENCRFQGTLTSGANSLTNAANTGCTNFTVGAPNLGALANNGGPTRTMALLAGSAAIGLGDVPTCNGPLVGGVDQRGFVRAGPSCDSGAFESDGATKTPTPTVTNTPAATNTPTRTPTPTNTNTPTRTPTPTNTNTPTATNTSTRTSTPTLTPTVTNTPTNTSTSTATATNTSTNTSTSTSTSTATSTPTNTSTSTTTSTPTNTSTSTATSTPTETSTATTTSTATQTATSTITSTATPALTATATATATPGGSNLKLLVNPVRVVDTRPAPFGPIGFTPNGSTITPGPFGNGETRHFKIAGQTFNSVAVPADATGVLINVSIVQGPTDPTGGFTIVFPGDQPSPLAATVNPIEPVPAGLALAVNQNFAVVGLAPISGTLGVTSFGQPLVRDVIVDLVGYFSPSEPNTVGNLKFIPPVRVLNTSNFGGPIGFDGATGNPIGVGPLAPGQINRFRLANKTFGTVGEGNQITFPATLSGVLAHITTLQTPGLGGFTTLLPGDATLPVTTATLNPVNNISFNSWVNAIPTSGLQGGNFGVFNSTISQDVIVDIVGYYATDNLNTVGAMTFINPLRVVDTRPAPNTTGFDENGTPITPGQFPATDTTRRYKVSGQTFGATTLPADLKGALMNVSIVTPGAPLGGFLTVYPGDALVAPTAATVNPSYLVSGSFWGSGLPSPPLNFPGTLAGRSVGSARDLIIDLTAYFR